MCMTNFISNSVLIVEDDPLVLMDACDAVASLGVECLVASDCESADSILQSRPCSCALLDFDLKQENSVPIAQQLATQGTPFCFVSGRSKQEILAATGFDAPVFTKPVNYAEIAETLLSST